MARTHRSPDGMFAGGGAVNQHDGKLPIYVCNDCGREVVWATSNRTGRKYLANISHGANGFRFYIGANVHRCVPVRTDTFLDEINHDEMYEEWCADEYAANNRFISAEEWAALKQEAALWEAEQEMKAEEAKWRFKQSVETWR